MENININTLKTQIILLLCSYIIGTKIFITHPLTLVWKAIFIISCMALWYISTTENGELNQMAYGSPILLGFFMAI